MAKVIDNSKDRDIYGVIEVGTYFIYQSQLFVRINEYETEKDVFNFNDNITFRWCDKFDPNAIVQIIPPKKITIKIS